MSSYYRNGENLTFKPITHAEERELFLKARAGDSEAREFLIKNFLLRAANYGVKKSKGMFDNDEVVSAMNEALMKAIDRFDPNFGNKRFAHFLVPWLQGAMAKFRISKNPVRVPKEVFDAGGTTAGLFVSTSEGRNEEHDYTRGSFTKKSQEEFSKKIQQLRDESPEPGEAAEAADQREYLLNFIEKFRSKLSERELVILDMVYKEGLNFAEVGVRLDVSREAIRVKHDAIIKKLRLWFKKEGVVEQ
jgi:RNA polymerase sigma factor (sigma-70 family)